MCPITIIVQDNVICVYVKGQWPTIRTCRSRLRTVRIALVISHRYDNVSIVWMN